MELILSRNKLQENAVQIFTSFLIQESMGIAIDFENSLIEFYNVETLEEVPIFIKELLLKALKHQNEIVLEVSSYLKNWKFSRLNTCVQAILILSTTNYRYMNTPKSVCIDLAVNLTKRYSETEDYKFVNAVLDNYLK